MARTGPGLSDNAGSALQLLAMLLVVASAYVAALPPTDAPRWVIVLLGGLGAGAGALERWLGVRDATTSAVAKKVEPDLPQYRTPDNVADSGD